MSENTVKIEMELDEESAKELKKWVEARQEKKTQESKPVDHSWFDEVQEVLMAKCIEFLNDHNERVTLVALLAAMMTILWTMEESMGKSREHDVLMARIALILNKASKTIVDNLS